MKLEDLSDDPEQYADAVTSVQVRARAGALRDRAARKEVSDPQRFKDLRMAKRFEQIAEALERVDR
ncbi:hypothetical protein WG926_07260 [Tistrella sp. BH-R2-4]|uniref:Uncharacterized protein n=1 Tax=Tistrella arctica TaxID=3133430 RepID=A0ABU9YH54_9PROT